MFLDGSLIEIQLPDNVVQALASKIEAMIDLHVATLYLTGIAALALVLLSAQWIVWIRFRMADAKRDAEREELTLKILEELRRE